MPLLNWGDTMKEPTTIIWLELPCGSSRGVAIVKWRSRVVDSYGGPMLEYVLGQAPPRYPVPATIRYVDPVDYEQWIDIGWCD